MRNTAVQSLDRVWCRIVSFIDPEFNDKYK
jgi:hypothetical protein